MIRKLMTIAVALTCAIAANALDLKGLLKGATSADSSSTGSILGAIKGAVNGALTTDKLTVAQIAGSWSYVSPAVSFKSDNILKKAGGSAAASQIESKLGPIYNTAGFNRMTLTIDPDSTFKMTGAKVKLSGNVTTNTDKESQANFVFNFKAMGKLKVAKMNAYVTKSPDGTVSLMFDVSKLMDLVNAVGNFTGNSTVKGLSSLLQQYDGLCAGFKMKSTAAPAASATAK